MKLYGALIFPVNLCCSDEVRALCEEETSYGNMYHSLHVSMEFAVKG